MIATGGPFGRELLAREAAAERRLHPDHRERIVEQQRRKDALGDVAAGDIAIAEIEGGGRGEGSTRLDVCVLGRRQRLDVARVRGQLRKRHADRYQAIRIRIRKRMEDEAVDHPVDQAVAADAESEREDRDQREQRLPDELPRGIPHVLEQGVHFSSFLS